MSINSIVNDSLGKDSFVSAQKPVPPTITGYVISGADDTALDPAGGQTVLINGSGFQRGVTVTLDGSAVAVVTWVNAGQLSFTTPVKSAGTYTIYAVNADGGTAIYIPGLVYSTLPTWSTSAGSLGSYYETKSISNTLTAAGDAPVTYSLVSGSLPTGASLNSSGVISGTAPVDSGSTTYSFTVEAIDAQLQSSTRSFSLTINTDAVTWTNPANGATITLDGTAYSNVLSATSAAGYNIASYTANTLPTGLTLTGNTISGTPSVEGNITTLLTATSSTTNRSGTNTITWVVSLGDAFFNSTTLLLPGSANTFVKDASTNNFAVTVVGDTKPNNFNPYLTGWSNQFDGNGDSITYTGGSSINFGTENFTIETWAYLTNTGTFSAFLRPDATATLPEWGYDFSTSQLKFDARAVAIVATVAAMPTNQWVHIAVSRSGTSLRQFINGTQVGSTTTDSTNFGSTTDIIRIGGSSFSNGHSVNGYLSNFRIVKGTAVYTANFTPPTAPLTAIAGTSLLTCTDNRFIDESANNFTITRNGDVKVQSFSPFVEPTTTRGSAYFDGTGDYLTAPANAALQLTGDFTVEAWIYPTVVNTFNMIFGSENGQSSDYFTIRPSTIELALGASVYPAWTQTFVANRWYHIAVTRQSNTLRAFVDGVQLTLSSGSATTSSQYFQSGVGVSIGRYGYTVTPHHFTGYISNARIVKGTAVYTAAFTPPTAPLTAVANTSLLTLQNNTPQTNNQFLDSSSNNLLVTRAGNATQGTFSPYGENWSNYFDGNGDYLSLASNAAFDQSTAFTVECWINSSAGGYFFSQLNSGYLALNHDASTKKIVVDKSYIGIQITSTNSFAFNQWHHVAMSYNGTTTRLFVNGALEGSVAGGGSASGAELRIGSYNSGSNFYTGHISNLRFVKGTAVYTSAFTPSTTPLQPIAGTSLLTCRDPNFVDDSPNNFTVTRNGDVSVQKFGPFAGTTLPTPVYSAYFDGTGDYLTTAGNTALDMGTGDFTIECFTISNGYSGSQYGRGLWALYPTGNYNSRILVRHSNAGQILGIYGWNGSSAYFGSSGTGGSINLVVGQWYHVAFVRQSGVFRLYINGVQDIVISNQTGISLAGSNCFDIGRCQDGSTPDWNGYISNFRAIKGTCLYPDGTTFTPPASPLTAISGTGILTCRSNTFVDSSSNAIALTVSGTPAPRTATPFSVTYSTKQSYTPAVFGGSMYFDGTGDGLSISDATLLAFGTGDFTVEFWIYLTSNSSTTPGNILHGGSNGGFGIYLVSTGIQIARYNVGGDLTYSGSVTLNTWAHLAFTRKSGTGYIFLNGTQVASGAVSTNYGASSFNFGGSNALYYSNFRLVKGQALYTSSFVPPMAPVQPVQNTTLLLNGTSAAITDATTNTVLETVGDARISTAVSKFGGSSMRFDGTGDYLVAPASPSVAFGTGNFTIECWVNYIAATNSGIFQIGASAFPGVNGIGAGLGTSNNWLLYYGNGSQTAAGSMTTATWYHVAVVRNSGTTRLYIDGTQVISVADTANYTGTVLAIGGIYSTSYLMNGYIQDFRITAGTARYTANFTPPSSNHSTK